MAQGCLAFLFGIKDKPTEGAPGQVGTPSARDQGVVEGEVHSGPGGYEGGSYTDGYAADYFHDEH